MDLFIRSSVTFEKVAAEVTLPEDPNAWPNEVLQELFKQVPYISDFEPHVVMDRVDAERGFGFGHVEVVNKTEIQHGASEEGKASAGIHQARIPVIIKDRKLQPFDVVLTEESEVLPLTESRLRQAIFRPSPFDITGKTPGDQSMIGQLYPPFRQNYGFGGGGQSMSVGMGKQGSARDFFRGMDAVVTHSPLEHAVKKAIKGGPDRALEAGKASGHALKALWTAGLGASAATAAAHHRHSEKKASLLSSILPTINESDYNAFSERMKDQGLQAAFLKNAHATAGALKTLASYEPGSLKKVASGLDSLVTPTVVQISKSEEGYVLKRASHHYWQPSAEVADRGHIVRVFGEKIAMEADMNGSVTMTTGEGAKAAVDPEEDKYELVSQFGIYKCRTEDGKEVIGYVFPNLLDVDGTALPLALFTNGSVAAVQGEISGVSVGGGANLFEGHPRGKGVFYELLPNGRAQATVPMTIDASFQTGEEGVVLKGETFDGRPVEVCVQPNITKITPSGDGRMLVPDTMCWLPLDKSDDVVLISAPDQANAEHKQASVNADLVVTVRSGGADSFTLSGPALDKVASEERSFLSFDSALFLLGGLGADLTEATTKLAQAFSVSAPVDVSVKRSITLQSEAKEAAVKTASALLDRIPSLRRDLLKEAAVLPDPVAVDTVLSLGFVNPENLSTFISYLPVIDSAQKKMCEILIAARLGLKDVSVSALERAIRSTEEIIEGLKVLAFSND